MTEEQQIEYALKMSLQGGNDEEDEDMAEWYKTHDKKIKMIIKL